ncbi:hypothetical protein GWK47_017387 [Chionoecetes opilio]|uniref:Uncharacterized protein n=1 Tax=Chionoecetes opilio TaxID=41210 RepID=A0A8J5CH66_CHIOP|nr:hypothetical protein GWK47_017387 [Chionoecetes opilio]
MVASHEPSKKHRKKGIEIARMKEECSRGPGVPFGTWPSPSDALDRMTVLRRTKPFSQPAGQDRAYLRPWRALDYAQLRPKRGQDGEGAGRRDEEGALEGGEKPDLRRTV